MCADLVFLAEASGVLEKSVGRWLDGERLLLRVRGLGAAELAAPPHA
jgi:hypothetical protein